MTVAAISQWLSQFDPGEDVEPDGLKVNRRHAVPPEVFYLDINTGLSEHWRLVNHGWNKEQTP